MEKRNSLLLTIIAIAVLLVSVVGATFAYFASTNTINATANLTATTGAAASFSSNAGEPLNLNITADVMMASETNDTLEPEARNGQTTLTISLTAAAGTTCTYDIGYVNTGNAYTAIEPKDKVSHTYEFEVEGSSNNAEEPDIIMGVTSYATIATGTTAAPYRVIEGASITVPENATEADDVLWTFKARFYNLNAEQATEKTYSGYFRVIEGSVEC